MSTRSEILKFLVICKFVNYNNDITFCNSILSESFAIALSWPEVSHGDIGILDSFINIKCLLTET